MAGGMGNADRYPCPAHGGTIKDSANDTAMPRVPGDDKPSPPTQSSRNFLEGFLEHVRRADLPGSQVLIRQLEEVLGRRPKADNGDLKNKWPQGDADEHDKPRT